MLAKITTCVPCPIQNCSSQTGVHLNSYTKPLCALGLAVAVLQYVSEYMRSVTIDSERVVESVQGTNAALLCLAPKREVTHLRMSAGALGGYLSMVRCSSHPAAGEYTR